MDRSDIEEMAKDLIPLAESTNAGETLMTTDYGHGIQEEKEVSDIICNCAMIAQIEILLIDN